MIQTQPLTFGYLDSLINNWITDTNEMINIFINQSTELNNWFFLIGNDFEQLMKINNNLNVIKLFDTLLEEKIHSIRLNNGQLEEMVNQLESKFQNTFTMDNIHPERDLIYSKLQNIFQIIKTISGDVDHLNSWQNLQETRRLNDQFEQMAKIMMLQLEQLEAIELKINRLANVVQQIECKRRLFLKGASNRVILKI